METERTRVKICGITCRADALAAVDAGADALGFMFFAGSKRHIAVDAAAAIVSVLPSSVLKVGVFVNASEAEVRAAAGGANLDMLQFHGEETPEYCGRFAGLRVWKAFRIQDRASLAALPSYLAVDGWLLDSYVPGERGGSGATFNWNLAVEAKALGRPLILAGGLTPENVGEAVRSVQPAWVDVSSGVELAPGRKSPELMRAFVAGVELPLGLPADQADPRGS